MLYLNTANGIDTWHSVKPSQAIVAGLYGGEDDSEYEYVEAVPEENSPLEHVDKAAMLLERANIEYN